MKRKLLRAALLLLTALLAVLLGGMKKPLDWNGRILLTVGWKSTPTNSGTGPTTGIGKSPVELVHAVGEVVSKTGTNSAFIHGVATAAQTTPDNFSFAGARYRKGWLLEVRFLGADSNLTAQVAAAASRRLSTHLMATFTNTNVEIVDIGVYRSPSLWRRGWDRVGDVFR